MFLIVLKWMATVFGHLQRDEVKKKVISYDNMCHLNNLKVRFKLTVLRVLIMIDIKTGCKETVATPRPLKNFMARCTKDYRLLTYFKSQDPRCKEQYSPDSFKDLNPDSNTMCCEQTFAWLSRYKRIVNAMPKTHHHFYLHRPK